MSLSTGVGRVAAGAAGSALGAVFGATARIRPTAKPLHPRGFQQHGTLTRLGSTRRWGVPWLDEPGTERVLVRYSRAVGLPAPLPDILGLTLRISTSEGDADLLLATTGRGPLSRFALLPRRDLDAGYGSLMAYRTPAGPVWLFARNREDQHRIRLSVAGSAGPVFPFADIEVDSDQHDADPTISFDPVLNPLPGLELYPWERRLREGAYAAARSSRC